MLSLNKLKSIEVKVVDNELPVTIHDDIIISDEDGYDEIEVTPVAQVRNETGIAMLVRMFKTHSVRVKAALKENYTAAWTGDMETLINNNGLTKEEFILCVNQ